MQNMMFSRLLTGFILVLTLTICASQNTTELPLTTTSGIETTTPGIETTTTGIETTTTGIETTTTGTEVTAPGMEVTAPGTEATTSGTEATTSGTEATTSGTETTTPSIETTSSGTETNTSGVETNTSGIETTAPGTEVTTPGTEVTAPGTEATTSGTEATTSGTEATTSGTEATTSGIETTTSGTEATTSGIETTTSDPCADCETNKRCPEACKCPSDKKKSLNGICAVPCAPDQKWCDGAGQACFVEDKNIMCACGADYYDGGVVGKVNCLEGRIFGGKMIFNASFGDYDVMKRNVEITLDLMFKNTTGYVKSEVIDLSNGSIIAKYKLIYESYSEVTDEDIKEAFNTSTKGCGSSQAIISESSYIVDCASKDTVVDGSVLCDLYEQSLRCDDDTAICNAANGDTTCVCKDPALYAKQYSEAKFCIALTCVHMNDSYCNPPYGKCVVDSAEPLKNYCECTVFGWTGSQCTDPWKFVFIIVTTGLGLILIGVLTACICMKKQGQSMKKNSKQEDMDLQNPFVDFQPGLVRAKVPSNMYSVSDSYETTNGPQSHTNGAYDGAYDELYTKQTSTYSGEQRQSQKPNSEYF